MQNIAIIAGVGIIIIGAIVFFNSAPADDAAMEDTTVTETADTMDEMDSMDEMAGDDMAATPADIVTTAVNTPTLSTLVAAVTAGELVETLQGAGPFTVFAPTNQAFAALPDGTVDTLLLPENIADLQGILTYHVVPGAVMSTDLTDGMVVETVNGESITINVSDAGVSINGSANVAMADIVTSNGVVHVIDGVLLPASE